MNTIDEPIWQDPKTIERFVAALRDALARSQTHPAAIERTRLAALPFDHSEAAPCRSLSI